MAYLFGAGNGDRIDIGAGLTLGASYTIAARFTLTQAVDAIRVVLQADDPNTTSYRQLFIGWPYGGNVPSNFCTVSHSNTGHTLTDDATLGGPHVVVATYDATTGMQLLYVDNNTTPVAQLTTAGGNADANTDMVMTLGNDRATHTTSLDGTLYEVGYWASALTATQAAALGAGGAMVEGFPEPAYYWPLISNADAGYGGHNGTVVGATLVAHAGTNWFGSTPPGSPKTYFVRVGGNNGADGLSDLTAWATTAKVNATTLNRGDVVQFRGGDTFSGQLAPTVGEADDPDYPIIFRSYGTGKATIQPVAGTDGFTLAGVGGIEVRNLIFDSLDNLATTTSWTCGIKFYNNGTTLLTHVYIDGCEASGFSKDGIAVDAAMDTTAAGWDDVRITGCIANGNLETGIWLADTQAYPSRAADGHMTNCSIADCVASNNLGTGSGHPLYVGLHGDGIFGMGWNGGTIERCLTGYNGANCNGPNGGPNGIIIYYSTGVTIQHNEAHHTTCAGWGDATGIDCDVAVSASIVQYNYVHDNNACGLLAFQCSGCTYRYNICENDMQADPLGIWWGALGMSGAQGNDWYGNTVYRHTNGSDAFACVSLRATSTGNRFFNNVFIASGSGQRVVIVPADCLTGTVFAGNAYWQTSDSTTFRGAWNGTDYTTLAAFRTASSQETGTGFNVDPLLLAPGTVGTVGTATVAALRAGLASYKLQPSSPILTQGLDLDAYSIPSPGTVDFFGTTLPTSGLTTLGASLTTSTAVPPPPLILLLDAYAEARA